jgi:hypothetical protein
MRAFLIGASVGTPMLVGVIGALIQPVWITRTAQELLRKRRLTADDVRRIGKDVEREKYQPGSWGLAKLRSEKR